MPSFNPVDSLHNQIASTNIKKVTWLELFFDMIFALALSMSAYSLNHISTDANVMWFELGEFIMIFIFLSIFWYRHMTLINRFNRSSFLIECLTLAVGFLVVAFIQFIRIWRFDVVVGSYLATITIFLATISMAMLYFIYSVKIIQGGEDQKRWARAYSKHMIFESLGYLGGILISPSIRPFWFIAVFLYFNKFPFAQWVNPKAQVRLPPELQNAPPEYFPHKSERISLFSLFVYGLILAFAAYPLLSINVSSLETIIDPILSFGKLLFFVSIIWYIHYKLINLTQPKGNQFTVLSFILLALLVATAQFIRILIYTPSNNIFIFFGVFTGLLLSILGIMYWNVKSIAGVAPSESLNFAFRRWAYFLYMFATGMFVSTFMPHDIRVMIWKIIGLVAFVGLFIDRGLSNKPYTTSKVSKTPRFLDTTTRSGVYLIGIGVVSFFFTHGVFKQSIVSLWILTWVAPFVIGFFMILDNWFSKRIKSG